MRRVGMVLSFVVLIALVGCSSALQAQEAASGDVVRVNYTLTLSDGTIADTSEGRAPLEFTLGAGDVVPGFDRGVTGLKVGESTEFTLAPEDGYGPQNPDLVLERPRAPEQEPPDMAVGGTVFLVGPGNIPIQAEVLEMNDETVTLDANHPLAGEELNFAVELVEIVAEQDLAEENTIEVIPESVDGDGTGDNTDEVPVEEPVGSEP